MPAAFHARDFAKNYLMLRNEELVALLAKSSKIMLRSIPCIIARCQGVSASQSFSLISVKPTELY